MNKPQIFSFNGTQVRIVEKDGQPWFVLNDVCTTLGDLSPRTVRQRLSEDVCSTYPLKTTGGTQQVTFINEDGLYDVILESRKPEARSFRKWVTSEVIPSIRKTGSYSIQNAPDHAAKAKRLEIMEQNAKTRQSKLMLDTAEKFKGILSAESIQLLVCGATEVLTGRQLLPKPETPILFTASDIGQEIGVSSNMIGRLANSAGLKTAEFGKWVLDKSRHSDKQVNTFLYNEIGRNRLIELASKHGRR